MIKKALILAAVACALGASPAAAQKSASFRFNGATLTVPLPQGFCVPSQSQQAALNTHHALDTRNVTHLTLVACGSKEIPDDIIILKSPMNAIGVKVDRKYFLDALGVVSRNFDMAKVTAEAEKNFSNRLETNVDYTGAVKLLGKDESCAYMGGRIAFQSDVVNWAHSAGTCMTSIGGHVLAVNSYGPTGGHGAVLKLLRQSKALANSIRVNPSS